MGRRSRREGGPGLETDWQHRLSFELNAEWSAARRGQQPGVESARADGDRNLDKRQSQHAALGRRVIANQLVVVRDEITTAALDNGFRFPQLRATVGLSYIAQSRLDRRRRAHDVDSPPVRRVRDLLDQLYEHGEESSAAIQPARPLYRQVRPSLQAVQADTAANNMPPGSYRIDAILADDDGMLEAEFRSVQQAVYPWEEAERRTERFTAGGIALSLAVVEPAHDGADVERLLTPELGLPRRVMLAPLDIIDVRLADLPEAG